MPFDRTAAGTMSLSRARPGNRAAARQVARWAAEALAETAPMQPEPEGWTPRIVGDQFVAALKWARYAAGRVGPAGMVAARLPEAFLTDEEHAAAGWGLKESADDPDDLPPMRVMPSPAQISRHLAALEWPAVYLVGQDRAGSARMVGLWAACKAYGRPFAKAIDGRGVSRPAAYALRDKGLSLISVALDREGVPVNI